METYWSENTAARAAISSLEEAGLSEDTFTDNTYNLDGTIKVGRKEVYFFAQVHRGKGKNKTPKVVLGFSLGSKSHVGDATYTSIEQQFETWRTEKERAIGEELRAIVGESLEVRVNHVMYDSEFPTVNFKGNDASVLMAKAKATAASLISAKYKLAGWYFEG